MKGCLSPLAVTGADIDLMIKITILLTRKKGMDPEGFHDYWSSVHGPLVMRIPENRRHVRKYVQSHILPDRFPFLASSGPLYDGAAEIWCENLQEGLNMFAEPKYKEIIYPDEVKFLDVDKTIVLVANEHLIYHRPNAAIHGGIKLFELPVRREGMTRSQFHRYWRDVHAPIVLGCPQTMEFLRRYVQSHSLEEPVPGMKPMPYDGMAELWFDSREHFLMLLGPRYREYVNSDESNFVNLQESTTFAARELIMYELGA